MTLWTDLAMLALLAAYWLVAAALVRGLERLEPRHLHPGADRTINPDPAEVTP